MGGRCRALQRRRNDTHRLSLCPLPLDCGAFIHSASWPNRKHHLLLPFLRAASVPSRCAPRPSRCSTRPSGCSEPSEGVHSRVGWSSTLGTCRHRGVKNVTAFGLRAWQTGACLGIRSIRSIRSNIRIFLPPPSSPPLPILDAHTFQAQCLQTPICGPPARRAPASPPGHQRTLSLLDCLCSAKGPKAQASRKAPVLMWIYGGGAYSSAAPSCATLSAPTTCDGMRLNAVFS